MKTFKQFIEESHLESAAHVHYKQDYSERRRDRRDAEKANIASIMASMDRSRVSSPVEDEFESGELEELGKVGNIEAPDYVEFQKTAAASAPAPVAGDDDKKYTSTISPEDFEKHADIFTQATAKSNAHIENPELLDIINRHKITTARQMVKGIISDHRENTKVWEPDIVDPSIGKYVTRKKTTEDGWTRGKYIRSLLDPVQAKKDMTREVAKQFHVIEQHHMHEYDITNSLNVDTESSEDIHDLFARNDELKLKNKLHKVIPPFDTLSQKEQDRHTGHAELAMQLANSVP